MQIKKTFSKILFFIHLDVRKNLNEWLFCQYSFLTKPVKKTHVPWGNGSGPRLGPILP